MTKYVENLKVKITEKSDSYFKGKSLLTFLISLRKDRVTVLTVGDQVTFHKCTSFPDLASELLSRV